MKSLLVLSAVALAAPAVAQTASAPASTNAAQPANPATPAQAPQPVTDAPGAQSGTSASPATPAQPANSADAVAQVVSNDWSKYDADTNDSLSKAEFGKWMTALQEQAPAQSAKPKPAGWTDAAFAQADKDKNGTVSKTELQGFLKG